MSEQAERASKFVKNSKVEIGFLILFLLSILFPPYAVYNVRGAIRSSGWTYIGNVSVSDGAIYVTLLLVEWVGLAIAYGFIRFFMLKNK
jgi:hypothetical protein